MPSLKELRNRITSVKATQKITKAMQMVAAAKLRRAQSAAEAARPYAERMEKVLANVAAGVGEAGPPLLAGTGKDDTHLLVVCTGERGLAGAFNTAIVRLARQRANRLVGEGKTVKIFTVGRKGADQLRRQFDANIVERTDFRGVRSPGFGEAEGVAKTILELFNKGEFDVCTMFYSQFRSVISQVPTAQQLIPLEIPEPKDDEKQADGKRREVFYEYEPGEAEILDALLPRNISIQILKALLENMASFFGAQMSAMDSATRNAGEMIKLQTLQYNRTRQAMITKELIEIISGAEAL